MEKFLNHRFTAGQKYNMTILFFSDERWFLLSRNTNSQINWWFNENSHTLNLLAFTSTESAMSLHTMSPCIPKKQIPATVIIVSEN